MRGVDPVQSSIAKPEMNDREKVANEGNNFAIGDDEEASFPEEMIDIDPSSG